MLFGLLAVIALAVVVVAGALVCIFTIAPSGNQRLAVEQAEAASGDGAAAATAVAEATDAETTDATAPTTTVVVTAPASAPNPPSAPASSAPSASVGWVYSGGDYMLADSGVRTYSRSELQNMSLYELYIARNEIYARHGRLFNKADLQQHFNSKGWYRGTIAPENFSDSMLNETERGNAYRMLDIEKSRNSPYV